MKRSSILGVLAVLAFAASPAFAQVQTRDHRKRPAPPPAPADNQHVKARPATPNVTGMSPGMGGPGTSVTITGTALHGVQVMVGGQPAAVTAQTPTSITFTIPADAKPGPRPIVLRRGRMATPAGRFRVQAVNVRDHRDHGDRDHRGDHRGTPPPPATGAPAPPSGAPVAPPPMRRAPRDNQVVRAHRRGHRSRDRMVVSGFWPREGRPGTKVIIRGENFADGTVVLLGDAELAGARVSPNRIEVAIPRAAAAGMISLRVPGRHRGLAVGSFAVTKKAAPKRPTWRTEAEKRWNERRKKFAKTRAEREAALQAQEQQLAATREQRRQQRIAARRAQFEADFLADADTVAELELHADRSARLQRILRLASADDMKAIGVRVEIAIAKEDARHDARMKDLRAAFGKEGADQ